MKEMLKSKMMVGFIIFVLGVTYLNSTQMNNFEESNNDNNLIVMNK